MKTKENNDRTVYAFWSSIALQGVAVKSPVGKFAGMLPVSMVPELMSGAAALIA